MYRVRTAFASAGILLAVSGCNATHHGWRNDDDLRTFRPEPARTVSLRSSESEIHSKPPQNARHLTGKIAIPRKSIDLRRKESRSTISRNGDISHVKIVGYQSKPAPPQTSTNDATLNIDGKTYRLQLVSKPETSGLLQTAAGERNPAPRILPSPASEQPYEHTPLVELVDISFSDAAQFPIDLPTALGMVGGEHPAIGFAQWRVQEAYAQLDRAEVLWLPSLQVGFSAHRHDGNYQASNGGIVDVNRNSFQYGLGAGATGAGTTPRPGLVAQFHVADAVFQPDIAEKNAWARGHAADATFNKQLLDAALGYLTLLESEQDRRIIEETRDRTTDLAKLTSDFAATGQGLQSDADRMATELVLVKSRLAEVAERADIASARLSQTLSLDAGQRIVPLDPTVVPIDLVSSEYDKGTLISTGLANRPELMELQNLVSAACDEYERQRFAPLIPSVLLGFSTGGFGGGLGGDLGNIGSRYDFDAAMMWEVRNLGFGEKAARRETEARIEQAKFEKLRQLDQVASEVAEAHSQTVHRRHRIAITENAIQTAENSYNRNVSRIRDGLGLPIEALQSLRALEEARRAYLKAVIEYNQAQFRLQWALGWSLLAPSEADES